MVSRDSYSTQLDQGQDAHVEQDGWRGMFLNQTMALIGVTTFRSSDI